METREHRPEAVKTGAAARLRQAGLRPTRQRLGLARLLLDGRHRHVTAEQLHGEALAANLKVSLATVYNTLNQFTTSGLLREVAIAAGRSYFDTNVEDHHHFYVQGSGELVDIPAGAIRIAGLPEPPDGSRVARVEVVIRLAAASGDDPR